MSKNDGFLSIFPKIDKRAVVLCDGPPPPTSLLEFWLGGADLFLCADRAGHPYAQLPRTPDVVIGDFDTLAGRVIEGRSGPRYLKVEDQDTSDSEKALIYAERQGCREAVMLGSTGWRLDHTLNNCALLERFSDRMRLCLSDRFSNTVRLGPGASVSWSLVTGTPFSLIPLAGPVTGVDVRGAAWPLDGADLSFGGPTAISNRVVDPPLEISVKRGSVLVSVGHAFRPLTAADGQG